MSSSANNEAIKALHKAEDALRSAEYDLKGGFELATANRAVSTPFFKQSLLEFNHF